MFVNIKIWRKIFLNSGKYICILRKCWIYQKGGNQIRKSKNRQYNGQKKNNQRTLHRNWSLRDTRHNHRQWSWFFKRLSSPYFSSGTHRVNLVNNPVVSHENENDLNGARTKGTQPYSSVTQKIYNDLTKSWCRP